LGDSQNSDGPVLALERTCGIMTQQNSLSIAAQNRSPVARGAFPFVLALTRTGSNDQNGSDKRQCGAFASPSPQRRQQGFENFQGGGGADIGKLPPLKLVDRTSSKRLSLLQDTIHLYGDDMPISRHVLFPTDNRKEPDWPV
jgi:hypothetical protein